MEPSHLKSPAKRCPRKDLKVLSYFESRRPSTRRQPKKEYVRCKLIRGHKRAIRQLISNTIPKTTIHKFNPVNFNAQRIWSTLKQITERYSEAFSSICKTEAGPITDGRAKRSAESMKQCEKSFNGVFCAQYFENVHVRESFIQYVSLIFVDFEPGVLGEKFEFYCCKNKKHSVECLEKWAELQRYLKTDMLEELGCDPVQDSNAYVSLPNFALFTEFDGEDFEEVQ
jgi:hypothetical protein